MAFLFLLKNICVSKIKKCIFAKEKNINGMQTIESINPKRADDCTKITEISARNQSVKFNAKDPVFLKPISALYKDHSQKTTGVLIFKIHN